MLNIYFGSLENEVYDPPLYFLNQYEDEWITSDLSREMILDIDRSTVIAPRLIDSPVLGAISPRELSGGVKTLILMKYDTSGYVFNATACGDNCASWILKIAEEKELTITLHNIMKFDYPDLKIRILNNGQIVQSFREYVETAIDYL